MIVTDDELGEIVVVDGVDVCGILGLVWVVAGGWYAGSTGLALLGSGTVG
jgi:hypothetical protein